MAKTIVTEGLAHASYVAAMGGCGGICVSTSCNAEVANGHCWRKIHLWTMVMSLAVQHGGIKHDWRGNDQRSLLVAINMVHDRGSLPCSTIRQS